jgi:hypothetical protein
MTELYWEHVEGEQDHPNVAYVVTQRAQVAGGYLYRVLHYAYDRRIHSVGGLAFVPDLAPVALTAEDAKKEHAAVVAWLRDNEDAEYMPTWQLADDIERGEHRREEAT